MIKLLWKLQLVTLFGLVVSMGFLPKAYAATTPDIEFECTITSCTGGPLTCDSVPPGGSGPLFFEQDMLPGDSIERTFRFSNIGNCICGLNLDTKDETDPVGFSQRLFTVIGDSLGDIVGLSGVGGSATNDKTLSDIFNAGLINLGNVAAGVTEDYSWVVTFDPVTGNAFQNAEASFDFDVEFRCGNPTPVDKTQRDRNPGVEHSGAADIDEETVLGTETSVFSPFLGFVGEVAGVEEQVTEEVVAKITSEEGDVKAIATCVTPWWWWLVFVVQILAMLFVYLYISEEHVGRRKRFYLLQFLITLVFVYIFWKYFCPWWDYFVSALIGLGWIVLMRRKFEKLENTLVGH